MAKDTPDVPGVHTQESTLVRGGLSWPPRPSVFPDLMTPVEAAQYLRLDETGRHTPKTAVRTLSLFRDQGSLKATKYAKQVWYRRSELERFLENKTEE